MWMLRETTLEALGVASRGSFLGGSVEIGTTGPGLRRARSPGPDAGDRSPGWPHDDDGGSAPLQRGDNSLNWGCPSYLGK